MKGGNPMAAYTLLPDQVFNNIAFDAGILASEFTPSTGTVSRSNILFATSGGSQFNPNISLLDLFEDVDNAKPGVKQGMVIQSREPHLTTNALTVNSGNAAMYVPNSIVTTEDGVTKIVPKDGIIKASSYFDIWCITNYATMLSEDGSLSGFFAIHMKNCLNVSDAQPTTTKDGKVQFALDLRAFYDATDPSVVPYEIYFKGTSANTGA
jgi:hypothetical protein